MKKVILSLLFILLFTSTSMLAASRWYVDTNRPDDSGDGSTWALAKKTITAASTLGASFDTVMVKGGTYNFTAVYAVATSRHYYGSCAGTETFTSQRSKSDVDGNGIVEPWEFTTPTVLSSTFAGSAFTTPNSGIIFEGFTFKHVATIAGGTRTLSLGNATAKFRNNIIRDCNVTVTMSSSPFSTMMKGLGNITDCLIEKNTYTINSSQAGDATISLIELAAGTATPGTKFRNVIVRNNKVNYNLSAAASSVASGRLFIQLSASTVANTYTTMSNCLIHNNEITYNPGTSSAALSASFVFMARTASSMADSVINCTFAKNKTSHTGVCAALKADFTSSNTPQFLLNNVLYDNQCGGTVVGLSLVATPASGGVFNNVVDGFAPADASPYISGNMNGLTLSNCGFLTPTTTVGGTTGVESEHSVWSLTPGSYLFGKGTATTNLYPYDKASNIFASTRSVGAYEYVKTTPIITWSQSFGSLQKWDTHTLTAASNAGAYGSAIVYTAADPTVALIHDGNFMDLLKIGNTTVSASQAANTYFNAATSVTKDIVVDLLTAIPQSTVNNPITQSPNCIKSNVNGTMQIISISGRMVQSTSVSTGQTINLKSGMYIVRTTTKNGTFTQKVVL